ncbi:MAG TPA: YcxB family protein [Kofleriaceae bacterium]|jgi:hypothetical protein
MIAIEFDHRLADHVRARRLYYARKSWFARGDKIAAIVLAVTGVASIAAAGATWWNVLFIGIAPLEWFHVLTAEPLVVRYTFARSPKFHEHTQLTFSAERIHYKTPSIDSTIEWNLFTDLVEDDQLFLLVYAAPRSYAVVPKRAFESEASQAEFRELARECITSSSA